MKKKIKKKEELGTKRVVHSIRIWHEGENYYGVVSVGEELFGGITDKWRIGPCKSADEVFAQAK